MSAPCEKHAALPVVGDSPCAGCEIERLRAENERLVRRDQMLAEVGCEYCGGSGWVHRIDGECLGACDQCPAYELSCAKHELEKMKAQAEPKTIRELIEHQYIKDLSAGQINDVLNQINDQSKALKAENELLRKDADRYRWLRDPDRCEEDYLDGPADNIVVGSCGGEDILWRDDLDREIDSAMSKDPLADKGQ